MSDQRIEIRNVDDYLQYKGEWVEPLILSEIFNVINREEIIKTLFPENTPENDFRFYQWIWRIKPHWCENCGLPLKNYSAIFVSHIKTRGAHTEIRYEPLNANLLCLECHNKWEYGTLEKKETMFIYWLNLLRGVK
jgi:5-methylcytosine-specific restriction endonuclease McrA